MILVSLTEGLSVHPAAGGPDGEGEGRDACDVCDAGVTVYFLPGRSGHQTVSVENKELILHANHNTWY